MNTETINEKETIFSVAPGVWGRKDTFVNFYMIRDEESDSWVLVDAGLKWSKNKIKAMASELFGENAKPSAIILTHGHFDHVGALQALVKEWDVPVYAHEMELPYLTGRSSYPPADASVGGGMMSEISFMYPTGPIDLGERIKKLPANGSIPYLKEWRFIETPGHSPGHISLFRDSDKVLIAGDAFVTTKAESAFYALTAKKKLSGPPKYFTCDWASAKFSLYRIVGLNPEIVATGHGMPMSGAEMRAQLETLATHFEELAQPEHGRYINEPALTNEYGVAAWPARKQLIPDLLKIAAASALVIAGSVYLYRRLTRDA